VKTSRRAGPAVLAARALVAIVTLPSRAGGPVAELIVSGPARGVATAAPVAAGVFVPESTLLRPGDGVALRDARGNDVPVQASPLVVDDAGRVRWLRVRFACDLASNRPARFHLRAGRATSPPPRPLRAIEADEGVAVNLASLVARVSRREGPLVRFGDVAGARFVLDAPSGTVDGVPLEPAPEAFRGLVVEEAGPLSVRIRLDGALAGPGGSPRLPYRCRLEFASGHDGAFVRLEIPAPDRALVPGCVLGTALRPVPPWEKIAKPSLDSSAGEETAVLSPHAGGAGLVAVRRRRGPGEPPALVASRDGIAIALVAPSAPFGLGRLASLEAYVGAARSGRRTFPGPSPFTALAATVRGSGAGDPPGLPGDPSASLPRAAEALLDRVARDEEKERLRHLRPEDFGDWERRPGTFGNLEFDTIDGLVRLALRRRDPRLLGLAADSYRHLRDVDVWRSPDAPFHDLRPRMHGPSHGGLRFEAGHTFAEGTIALGLVAGDPAILEDGLAVAGTAAARFVGDDETYRRERGLGWLLHGLAAAAETAREEKRAAFRGAIVEALDRLESIGGPLPILFSAEDGGSAAVSSWVAAGVLVPGLLRASDATGDPRGTAAAARVARFVAENAPREGGRGGFSLANEIAVDPAGAAAAARGRVWDRNLPLASLGLAAAARATGDPLVRSVADRAFAEAVRSLAKAGRLDGEIRSKILRGLLRREGARGP